MVEALIALPFLIAVGAWIVAVASAIQVVRMVPAGERLTNWFRLGWWQFDKIEAAAGPQSKPLLRRYMFAFLAFFGAIVLGMVLTVAMLANQAAPMPSVEATQSRPIDDPRVIAVRSAGIVTPNLVRVAGTLIRLES